MDLIIHFREKLKKSAPHFPQKNNRKQNKKTAQTKTKQKHNKKNTKKQQQTKQAENCESVYWHTQVRVFCLRFCWGSALVSAFRLGAYVGSLGNTQATHSLRL